MDTDWSIAAGADDPMIVVPWDPSGASGYVDLAKDQAAIDQIPEAREWPEVRVALQALNVPGSKIVTSKCDAWVLDEEEKQLDFGPVLFGFGAYFDIVVAGYLALDPLRSVVERWAAGARKLDPGDARADFVIRPASLDDQAGYAVTLYLFGYGKREAEARSNWAGAIAAVTALVARVPPGDNDTMEGAGE